MHVWSTSVCWPLTTASLHGFVLAESLLQHQAASYFVPKVLDQILY